MRSGELAAAAGVNQETLRYYERRGLLPEPARSLGGHRVYDDDALTVLKVIKAAQSLGFTLGETKELLTIGSHRGPRPGLRERALGKIPEVDAKIAALQTMRAGLLEVIEAGCVDLVQCTCEPSCPIPFPDLVRDDVLSEDDRRPTR